MKIELNHWDSDKCEKVLDGEIDTYTIAKVINAEQMAALLDDWVNSMDNQVQRGIEIGKTFASNHPSLQQNFIELLSGMLMGFVKYHSDYTDQRNQHAVGIARKLVDFVKADNWFGAIYEMMKDRR